MHHNARPGPKNGRWNSPDTSTMTELHRARFWSSIDVKGPYDCWNWKAGLFKSGYGQFRVGKKKLKAHRIAYALLVGPIPTGLLVIHSCDNRLCCNRAHLSVGTQMDNARDRVARDRSRYLYGAANPISRLTQADAREIRRRYENGETQRAIAGDFGVSQTSIGHVVRGATWRSDVDGKLPVLRGAMRPRVRRRRADGTFRSLAA